MYFKASKPSHFELPPAYSEEEMQEMLDHGARVAKLCREILFHK